MLIMLREFTYHVKGDDGIPVIMDIECEVEIQHDVRDGEMDIECVGVHLEQHDLLKQKSPTLRHLGLEIATAAERDDWIIDQVKEDGSYSYLGLGGNDPDGRLVRQRI